MVQVASTVVQAQLVIHNVATDLIAFGATSSVIQALEAVLIAVVFGRFSLRFAVSQLRWCQM
jgi:hypothetical protein